MYAIIGGTGVELSFPIVEKLSVDTPYGVVSLDVVLIHDQKVVLLSRHGQSHSIPPHLIPYKANIFALKKVGVTHVLATATVGSMNQSFLPGSIVLLTDFLDFTKNRDCTFYTGDELGVAHVDMGDPYCVNLRAEFEDSAKKRNIRIFTNSTYVSVEGPRFETKAEIKLYTSFGADLVGMTNVPEVVLAKELGLCYMAVGLVSNMAAGIKDENLAKHDFSNEIKHAKEKTFLIFEDLIAKELNQNKCNCTSSVLKL